MGAVLGDHAMSLRNSLGRSVRIVSDLVLLTGAAFYPAMQLHVWLHHVAVGKPASLVWVAMTGDALVVGLLASLVGSALYVAYAAAGTGAAPAPARD
jgi:hypothetical protein